MNITGRFAMSSKASQQSPMPRTVHSADGHGRRKARPQAMTGDDAEPGEGTLGPVPPPLPNDPAVRAELRQRLERGLAAARAGIGEDWEVVHARIRARLNLPPL